MHNNSLHHFLCIDRNLIEITNIFQALGFQERHRVFIVVVAPAQWEANDGFIKGKVNKVRLLVEYIHYYNCSNNSIIYTNNLVIL